MKHLKSYKIFEAFKSNKLSKLKKQLEDDHTFELYFEYLTESEDIRISELTDDNILFVSPYEVESKLIKMPPEEGIPYDDYKEITSHNSKFVFWFTDEKGCLLLTKNYIEDEGNVYNYVMKRNGVTGYEKQLDFYDYCIIIDFNNTSKNRTKLVSDRKSNRRNAISLKKDKEVREENMQRYREFLVSKYNFTEDMSELSTNMRKLLNLYFTKYSAYRLLIDRNTLKSLVSSLDDLHQHITSEHYSDKVKDKINNLYSDRIRPNKYTREELKNLVYEYSHVIDDGQKDITEENLFELVDLYDEIDEKIKSIIYKSEIKNGNNIYRLSKTLELISDISNRYNIDFDYLEGYNEREEEYIIYLIKDVGRIKRQIKLSENIIELLDTI